MVAEKLLLYHRKDKYMEKRELTLNIRETNEQARRSNNIKLCLIRPKGTPLFGRRYIIMSKSIVKIIYET
jgi:hypothetical protein